MPTALRVARGNPGHRPLNKDEPEVDAAMPVMPAWLDAQAQQRWEVLAPLLARSGLLTDLDGDALAAYCVIYSRWQTAEKAIKDSGQVIKTRSGNFIQSPYVGVAHTAMKLMRAYEEQFGMTPSARSRVKVAKGKTPADRQRDRFFGMNGGRR